MCVLRAGAFACASFISQRRFFFFFWPGPCRIQKWDLNVGGPISTDYIGAANDYPRGNATVRQRIIEVRWPAVWIVFLAT